MEWCCRVEEAKSRRGEESKRAFIEGSQGTSLRWARWRGSSDENTVGLPLWCRSGCTSYHSRPNAARGYLVLLADGGGPLNLLLVHWAPGPQQLHADVILETATVSLPDHSSRWLLRAGHASLRNRQHLKTLHGGGCGCAMADGPALNRHAVAHRCHYWPSASGLTSMIATR